MIEVIVVFSPWTALCNLFYLITSSKRRPKCLSKHLNCCHVSGLLNALSCFEISAVHRVPEPLFFIVQAHFTFLLPSLWQACSRISHFLK